MLAKRSWDDQPYQYFMQHLPQQLNEPNYDPPRVDELWTVVAEGRKIRSWQNVNNEEQYHCETLYPTPLTTRPWIGHIYEVESQEDGDITWRNVLTGIRHQEYSVRQAAATQGEGQFILAVKLRGFQVRAMVDCGCMLNFINKKEVVKYGIATRVKDYPYKLITIDRTDACENDGWIETETEPIEMVTPSGHKEIIVFDVALITHPIVVGMPWLVEHNPTFDWKERTVEFVNCVCGKTQDTLRLVKSKVKGLKQISAAEVRRPEWSVQYQKEFSELFKEVGILGYIQKLLGIRWGIWAKPDLRTSSWSSRRSSRTSNRWLASSGPFFFPIRNGDIITGIFHDDDILYDGMIMAFNTAIGRLGKEEQAMV
jgi:hypothetical protein